jgi:cytochrome c biogenesis protein CcmG, thiol:disulfide interchange protein DsbE
MSIALTAIAAAVLLVTRSPAPTIIGGHPLLDAPAPDIALRDIDGHEVRLADYRGRPVIVNFWASWCIPCREEFPILKAARERFAAQGLEVLGVVFDDDPEAARAYMAKAGATWPALVDPGGAVAAAYLVNVPPLSFFVDGAGIVRSIAYGPPPSGSIDDRITAILPAAASAPPDVSPAP